MTLTQLIKMKEACFFDLHVHPTIKPFGQLCGQLLKKKVPIIASTVSEEHLKSTFPELLKGIYDHKNKMSLWHEKKPNKLLNSKFAELAFAKYSQSNLTTAAKSECKVLCTCLYPTEKEFLTPSIDQKTIGIPFLKNMVTGIGTRRIEYIQSGQYKYFQDIEAEYEFLKTTSKATSTNGYQLALAKNINEVKQYIESGLNGVVAIPCVEGTNVFYPTKVIESKALSSVLENIEKMKNWDHPPMYVSLAHHFYNGFVSHEKSLVDFVSLLGDINQKPYMNQALSELEGFRYFTKEGVEVLKALLSSQNGRRIIIDVKHMDYRARQEYYAFLEREYNHSIPVMVSHGAIGAKNSKGVFNNWTLNLNDNDIDAVWKTNGLIGIELDQRVLGFSELKKYKRSQGIKFNKMSATFNSELVWNALHYVANRCAINMAKFNKPGDPWKHLAMGSDYDGLINPINKFPMIDSYYSLESELIKHAQQFLDGPDDLLKTLTNKSAQEIIRQIMYKNGMQFLETNYV